MFKAWPQSGPGACSMSRVESDWHIRKLSSCPEARHPHALIRLPSLFTDVITATRLEMSEAGTLLETTDPRSQAQGLKNDPTSQALRLELCNFESMPQMPDPGRGISAVYYQLASLFRENAQRPCKKKRSKSLLP